MQTTTFYRIAWVALALTFVVVILGAYVRLSDAGLGCPDWPGCYGKLLDIPDQVDQIAAANSAYPHRPVEPAKAWKEMIHRYCAGTLGLLILALAVLAWRDRRQAEQPIALPLALLGLIIFQSLLGMWTVTWQLKPVVVMAHLLGGLTTLSLLVWLLLGQRNDRKWPVAAENRGLRHYALVGLVLLVVQIALGGWTSSNYAALACPDFPTCQSQWWPPLDFQEAFTPWRGLGKSYEGGVLANDARVAIHLMHRIGALIVALYLSWLSWRLIATGNCGLHYVGNAIIALLTTQIGLGIANITLHLPLPIAVAHTGGAALLLLALVTLNHLLRPEVTA